MEQENIISKIKESGLSGRSGSGFPVASKWEAVKKEKEKKKYLVCNASEGELDTFKDYFILKNYPQKVIKGMKIAMEALSLSQGYIYLNENYFEELYVDLKSAIGKENIVIVKKKGGYVGGEETAVISVIEKGFPEPRSKPPFPAKKGLWGLPTLLHNVETFYFVAKIKEKNYRKTRFYSIWGDVSNRGVYELSENSTIRDVLGKTGNTPSFDYFLQVGGGGGGTIMLPNEIDIPFEGIASVIVYRQSKTDPYFLMKKWVNFLLEGNCDKCTPCREGLYRIMEMIERKDFKEIDEMFSVMEKTSLCPLGKVAVKPFQSLLEKIIL